LVNARTLGRYELLQRLAVGGMAELFLARSRGSAGFEKQVVIKRILPDIASEPEFRALFIDEARLVATFAHPNIVQVFDLDETDEELFFAMEYVHGVDAHKLLRTPPKTPLAYDAAIEIVCQAAAGLHYAHERTDADGGPLGVVHRDVSPNNLLCTWDGHVKVVDFGIAKVASRSARFRTRIGTVRGTPVYMSPEQARGLDLDRRSDVFSLAIVLYELTTGARCFDGDHDFAVLHNVTTGSFRPPTTVRDDYPAALEAIVCKGLAVDRDARYQTAAELAAALDVFVRDHRLARGPAVVAASMQQRLGPPPARPAPAPVRAETAPTVPELDSDLPSVVKRRRAWPVVLAISVAVAAVSAAIALTQLRESPAREVEQAVASPPPALPPPPPPSSPPASAPPPQAEPRVQTPAVESAAASAPAKRTTKRSDRPVAPAPKAAPTAPKPTRALDLDSALP
jgi:eukaryotic-like serine/threonine-protein kinase